VVVLEKVMGLQVVGSQVHLVEVKEREMAVVVEEMEREKVEGLQVAVEVEVMVMEERKVKVKGHWAVVVVMGNEGEWKGWVTKARSGVVKVEVRMEVD
jgi:hypothetical protein